MNAVNAIRNVDVVLFWASPLLLRQEASDTFSAVEAVGGEYISFEGKHSRLQTIARTRCRC
jgi:hypothetical protein